MSTVNESNSLTCTEKKAATCLQNALVEMQKIFNSPLPTIQNFCPKCKAVCGISSSLLTFQDYHQ